ncbi:hypothetical protein TNCV_2562001 [Trichonephila clavipes]|uniref:Uncharacterized protein n=1 Tax=Trichonephila clavipes TaxID=2585209 RepID=A0A8X6R0V3_TRICX|nr:hypothetical protein TNCV_2562001 [Trichonephila clavipes]
MGYLTYAKNADMSYMYGSANGLFHITRHDVVRRTAVRSSSKEESILNVVADRTKSSTRTVAYYESVSHQMVRVYEDQTMSMKCEYDCYSRLQEGRDSVSDNPRSGRPVTSASDENIKKFKVTGIRKRGRPRLRLTDSVESDFGIKKVKTWRTKVNKGLLWRNLQMKALVSGVTYNPAWWGAQASRGPQSLTAAKTATAGSDVVQSGRPIFDDFFQHLWSYIGNNTANVVFQMVKRLWLIRIDQ